MLRNELPEATRIVSSWHSRCNACGKECHSDHKTHDVNLGYNMKVNGTPGCGVKFTHEYREYLYRVNNSPLDEPILVELGVDA